MIQKNSESMKQKTGYVLNQQDETIIHLFTNLGMPKNLAKTLLYISQVEDCRSQDIERGVELLQPQVSLAIQELKKKGWVKKHDKKKKGKGRPVHHYHLTKPLSELIKNFQNDKVRELETIKKNFSELETILIDGSISTI
jgi:predicted transcriptional regulator